VNDRGVAPRHTPMSMGSYSLVMIDGTSLVTSALGPVDTASRSGFSHVGRLGESLDANAGREAAAIAARALLSAVELRVGSLDAIESVVQLRGYLATTPDFGDHAAVMDGASDLVVAVLGPRGEHARTTVGVASLPFGLPVVVELTARLRRGLER
jgi:enamine deaminase RidA (YjgF/YER057c/UK114 family)